MKILVCGSRTFTDADAIERELRAYTQYEPNATVIEGAARGADIIAGNVAHRMGFIIEEYPADWNKYGKRAGFIRNTEMLAKGRPDIVIAFWDGQSRGTAMMIEIAKKAGVPVKVITNA